MLLTHFRSFLCAIVAVILGAGNTGAFQLGQRWTDTATNPFTNIQGTPMTVTWGFAPDGTITDGGGASNLIAFLDNIIGAGPGGSDLTQRPWFPAFDTSMNRWGQLSGMTYNYEPNDDAVPQTAGNIGILGVRGDVRIAGRNIDGAGNVLAFNNFPNFGDMVIDTGDTAFYSNTANNRRNLRNVIMHEHGHGMGLFHVESTTSGFLMEPFIQSAFDGPQLDDLMGAQRHYGDMFERSNGGLGNDTFLNATSLGAIPQGSSVIRGTHGATGTVVLQAETDFVSIDDNSDLDFFSFSIAAPSMVNLTLTPVGATYMQGPQGGAQASFNASQQSNLT
ncbi:MAG TPA: matrixin family metalloprotease, partial [Pirellulaceae bacterium]